MRDPLAILWERSVIRAPVSITHAAACPCHALSSPQGITWDDGCFKCKLGSEGCRKNDYWDGAPTENIDKFMTCSQPQSVCEGEALCDLEVM